MRKISDENQKSSGSVNTNYYWPIYEIFDDELKTIFEKHAQILLLDFSTTDFGQESNVTNELTLGRNGLKEICNELHLSDHYDFIVQQLLPLTDQRLNFENFQDRFVQVVTQIFGLDIHKGATETEKTNWEKFNQNQHGSSNSADDWTTDPREHDHHASRHHLNELQSNDGNNRDENNVIRSKFPTSSSYVNKNLVSSPSASMTTTDVHLFNVEKFSTNNNRNTEDQIQRILANLGLADRGYLVPYDLRILCQHLGLNCLTSQELAALFNHLDSDGDGKISVQDFLNAYPIQQHQPLNDHDVAANCSNISQTVAVADVNRSYCSNSSLIEKSASRRSSGCANRSFKSGTVEEIWTFLFSSLDVDNSGQVTVMDLVRHWKCNNMVDCLEMLRNLKVPTQGETKVNIEALRCAFSELMSEKCDSDPIFNTMLQILKAEIMYSNESLLENREQISFFTREVQQLNQRNGLLVDELEQNHQNLEVKSQQQLRDLEEKYQNKIAALEQKYKNEREQWYEEMKDRDEMIHKAQQNESSSQYRHRQLERENFKLKAEIDDLLMTLKELEGANDDLRTTLEEAYSLRKKSLMDESQKSFYMNAGPAPQTSTPRSARVPENNSKKLKRKRQGPILTPILLRRSMRRQKLLLDESSEFESDPADYMFDRIKCKRPLKKKQRLALVAHRLQSPHHFYESPTSSSSESLALPSNRDRNDKSSVISLRFNDCCSVINTHLSSLEKHLNDDYQFWIKQLKMDVADLETNFESEKRSIKEEYERRIDRMTSQFAEEKLKLTDCIESDLRKKFEQEKRDIEIRFLSERNILERRFAEEKMKIMERLQDEFDTELKRVKNSKCCFNASHAALIANSVNSKSNASEKQKLAQEQTKLQNRVKSLVEELNFVRTRLNAEEREKANLKVYSEQLKRDFTSKYSNDRKIIKDTVDQMNRDMALLTEELNNLRSENELLKSRFVDHESKITQTDDSGYIEAATFQDEKLVDVQIAPYERSSFRRVQGVHSDDQSFSRKSADAPNNIKISMPLSSTESACEAELYFESKLPRSELSLLNFCDQLNKDKCDLSQKVSDYEQIIDDLSARLAEQTNENTELVGNLKRLHNELENFQRIDYDSVKIEAIKSTLYNFLRRAMD